jgi:hypothetical protein
MALEEAVKPVARGKRWHHDHAAATLFTRHGAQRRSHTLSR